ncbi:MAG: hypothetical protein ACRENE_09985 [Polyangiaceae bacterium]
MAGALALVNVGTCTVVNGNLHAGVYRPDADSIGIPIFSTMIASALVCPFLAWVALFSPAPSSARSVVASVVATVVSLVAYAVSEVFGLAGMAYWTAPHHYAIVGCYVVVALLVAALFALDVVQRARRTQPGE